MCYIVVSVEDEKGEVARARVDAADFAEKDGSEAAVLLHEMLQKVCQAVIAASETSDAKG